MSRKKTLIIAAIADIICWSAFILFLIC